VRTAILLILLLPISAFAADWSLPLNGYYRLGHYMPVRFPASAAEFRISADGMVKTVVSNPVGGVAPCFVSREPAPDSPMAVQLHELGLDERLVGIAADAGDIPQILFPGQKILTVPLDPVHPLEGSPAAWQTLDAIVMTNSAAASLPRDEINSLLAGGVSLAVSGGDQSAPSAQWPWQPVHGGWILRAPAAPIAAASDDFYTPITGWSPGRPPIYRWQIVVFGVILAIAVLLISLLAPRWSGALALLLAIAAIVAAGLWQKFQPEYSENGGAIVSPDAVDVWVFDRALLPCVIHKLYRGLLLPIVPVHGGPDAVTLMCDPAGTPTSLDYQLTAGRAGVSLQRSTLIPHPVDTSPEITTPLRFLLPFYPGLSPVGQIAQPGGWPSLVLAKSDAIPK